MQPSGFRELVCNFQVFELLLLYGMSNVPFTASGQVFFFVFKFEVLARRSDSFLAFGIFGFFVQFMLVI